MPSSPTFPGIDALIWIMWVAGGALLLAGWLGRVDRAVGWAGLWIGAVGFAAYLTPGLRGRVAVIAIGVILLLILAPLHRKRSVSGRWDPLDHEAELIRLCHGDKQMAERLIRHELERSPEFSRAGAALAAATRLKHDKS
jgi:hypothetical protein